MPPFIYEGYRNPYAGSIADLLLQRGAIDAQAAERIAAARAGAVTASGNAWAGAARDIGQLPNQIMAERRQQQESQARGLDIQTKQAQLAREQAGQAVGQLITKHVTSTDDGHLVYDIPGFMAEAQQHPDVAAFAHEPLDAMQKANDTYQAWKEQRFKTKEDLKRGIFAQVAEAGGTPDDFMLIGGPFIKGGSLAEDDLAPMYRRLSEIPDQAARVKLLNAAAGVQPKYQTIPEGSTMVATQPGLAPETVATGKPKPPTETELALQASGGDPVAALRILKPGNIEQEWLARDRRIAVAKNGGKALTDEQAKAVDTASMQSFAESKTDPAMREAALAQKNVALLLAQAQLNQQPTKEQAASVAEDLVNHRIAPEQLASLFSTRGKEGLAFKLAVTSEAKKLDPSFNFEEASATYGLVKSQGFQNTVRYLDSALESIPRLEENTKNLGNGSFRTFNAVANAAKNQFNSTDLKRFKTDALLVGDEIAKILSGGGTGSATSDAKLKQATEIIGQSDSVPAIAAAMDEVKALMGNRRRALTRGTYLERAETTPDPLATAKSKLEKR